MTETIYSQVIMALIGALASLLFWTGKRIFMRLDELMRGLNQSAIDHANSMAKMQQDHSEDLLEIYKAMKSGDDELHQRVTSACGRISRLEAASEIQHGTPHSVGERH